MTPDDKMRRLIWHTEQCDEAARAQLLREVRRRGMIPGRWLGSPSITLSDLYPMYTTFTVYYKFVSFRIRTTYC